MIYVFEEGNIVYDERYLTEEDKIKAVAVEVLPVAEERVGKVAQIKSNLETQEIYFEYMDVPVNDELEELKKTVADLTEIVLLGGI